MAVLNVTPDSFSDGGHWSDVEGAVERGRELAEAGAAIIDVGGESSRPGAQPVSTRDELERVLPVVERLVADGHRVSVDTCKPEVAKASLDAGAVIVNDITGLSDEMLEVLAQYRAIGVCMHMQGEPRTMQVDPHYEDVVGEVRDYLEGRLRRANRFGVEVIVDPGIGFGKSLEHNLELLRRLDTLKALGAPVLVGVSRKSFLGRLTGREIEGRLAGTLACNAWALAAGADILRVHDIAEHRDLLSVFGALSESRRTGPRESARSGRGLAPVLVIEIENIEVQAHIGVPQSERVRAQPVRIGLVAEVARSRNVEDRLDETVDYAAVVELVRAVATERPRQLLETLAQDITSALEQRFALDNVEVRAGKPAIERQLRVGRLEVRRSSALD